MRNWFTHPRTGKRIKKEYTQFWGNLLALTHSGKAHLRLFRRSKRLQRRQFPKNNRNFLRFREGAFLGGRGYSIVVVPSRHFFSRVFITMPFPAP
jgi:uncharacterized C2H2 Zn-finger protein